VIEPAVGERDLVEHGADARPIGDVRRETDGWSATADAGTGNTDAEAALVGDLLGGRFSGGGIEINGDDVRAFFHEPMRGFLADAAACSDDDDDLTRQLFLGGHALELGLLEQPILDIERLLLRERDVFIDRLGAAHHFDGAVVEFRRDSRLGLVLAPGDHAQAGDENHVGFGSRIAGEFGCLQRL
jgi:hypothetical protein